VEGIACRTV